MSLCTMVLPPPPPPPPQTLSLSLPFSLTHEGILPENCEGLSMIHCGPSPPTPDAAEVVVR